MPAKPSAPISIVGLAKRLKAKPTYLYGFLWGCRIEPEVGGGSGKKGGRPRRLLSAAQVGDVYRRLRDAGHAV